VTMHHNPFGLFRIATESRNLDGSTPKPEQKWDMWICFLLNPRFVDSPNSDP
jgi:hypothetical protein